MSRATLFALALLALAVNADLEVQREFSLKAPYTGTLHLVLFASLLPC